MSWQQGHGGMSGFLGGPAGQLVSCRLRSSGAELGGPLHIVQHNKSALCISFLLHHSALHCIKINSLPTVNGRWVEEGDGYVWRLQPPGQPLGVGLPSGLQCLVPYRYRFRHRPRCLCVGAQDRPGDRPGGPFTSVAWLLQPAQLPLDGGVAYSALSLVRGQSL
jgi:hypothetical protein